MFLENKYSRIYYTIIDRACQEKRVKTKHSYYEKHHIIPKSLGGTNDNSNLVFLTSKEHILVHRLLCHMTEGTDKIKCLRAFHCMCFQNNGGKNKRKPTIGQLAAGRKAVIIANSVKRGIKGAPAWSYCKTLQEFIDLLEQYVKNNVSDPKIAGKYNVSAAIVHNWRNKLGIKRRRHSKQNKDWLFDQYYNLKKSCARIGRKNGWTATRVQQMMQEHNIMVRSASERQKLAKQCLSDAFG